MRVVLIEGIAERAGGGDGESPAYKYDCQVKRGRTGSRKRGREGESVLPSNKTVTSRPEGEGKTEEGRVKVAVPELVFRLTVRT